MLLITGSMAEDIDNTLKPPYQTVKTSLKSVVRNDAVIEKLTNAAFVTNAIMTHTLQFLKIYLLHLYDANQPLPRVDTKLVNAVMKTIAKKGDNRGRKPSEAKGFVQYFVKRDTRYI